MIVQNKKQLQDIINEHINSEMVLIPTLCDKNLHPIQNELSLLYVKWLSTNQETIIVLNHSEQRQDNDLNVKFVISHHGLDAGADGIPVTDLDQPHRVLAGALFGLRDRPAPDRENHEKRQDDAGSDQPARADEAQRAPRRQDGRGGRSSADDREGEHGHGDQARNLNIFLRLNPLLDD